MFYLKSILNISMKSFAAELDNQISLYIKKNKIVLTIK